MAVNDALIVVALDFGTTYSGYAFQFKHEYDSADPTKISAPQSWNDGTGKVSSNKTPTCLLLTNDKAIDSFGFEAESKFSEICMEGQQDKWYFFKRFKMQLHNIKNITANTMIRGENKRELPAIEVFSKSIQCLKDKLLEDLNNKTGTVEAAGDIFYVLTVPAIWNDHAKQFMRQAAVKAGIKSEQLAISLEPECASLFSQYLPVDRTEGDAMCRLTAPGTVYMIVDLGGGTADITVHEKLEGGKLREVHHACGGPWGGVMVDAFFIQLLSGIITAMAMSEFMFSYPGDYHDMMRDFEILKRKVDTSSQAPLTLKIPPCLNDVSVKYTGKSFAEACEASDAADDLTVNRDRLRISADAARALFGSVAERVMPTIEQCIQDVRGISLILMVGGFSESTYMQETIKQRYDNVNGMKVLVPPEAGLSVLKGAVIFGRQPCSITARILRYTYGADVTPIFDPKVHDVTMATRDGKRCTHVFKPFMTKGTEVKLGEECNAIYHTTVAMQQAITLKIYATQTDDVKYTTDAKCDFVGTLTMTLNTPREELHDLLVTYIFGDTEIKVIGVEKKTNHRCVTVIKMNE